MVDVAAELAERLDHLRTSGPTPGRAWCRAWSAAVDRSLTHLYLSAAEHGRFALAAVGGYGREELCPASDIDLLVLHDRLGEDALEEIVRIVVYPLWDAGLKVGYAVRDRKQAVAAVKDDLDTATALLDGRYIVGDGLLLRQARDEAIRQLRKKPAAFLASLTSADAERRARAGDAAEVLEPDVKSGAGGLRDVQSLRWAAAALVGEVGLDPLVSARYLGAPDRTRLARAYDQLLALRVALHLEGETGRDLLRLDLQEAVAARLGYVDGADDRDTRAHRLLSAHFLAARTIDHVHRRAWTLLEADAMKGRRFRRPTEQVVDGFELHDGVLRVPDDQFDLEDAGFAMRLFAVLVEHEAVLDRVTAAKLRRRVEARNGEPVPWTGSARERFLRTLWRGAQTLPALAELDDVGLLVALLPEWAPARGRAQRNPFHRFSLDRHSWHAAAELAELVRRERWATVTLERVDDREALMLGTLLHDLGKAYGEPHSESGVAPASSVLQRMGVGEATVHRVARLIRLHLLLPDAATKRDLADPDLSRQVAKQLDNAPGLLASLHLLTAADGRATGPSAWSDWKASLVQSLVTKVQAVLDDLHPDEVADGAVTTAREALRIAADLGADEPLIRDHLALLPQRYAASVSPRAVVRHALVARTELGPVEVRTRVTPGETDEDGLPGYDELDVVAIDRPGLFAKVAGVVALHGGSIVQASAFTRDDGIAVDTFTVNKPEHAVSSWWAAVEGDIDEAVSGRLALRARVARKAESDRRRLAKVPHVPTVIECTTEGDATVVEIHAMDRIGVLFDITSSLAELELDIVVAKIQTLGHEVVDVFYVRDGDGNPLDEDHARELKLALGAALEF